MVAALTIALAALTVPGAGSASASSAGIVAQAKARLAKLAKPSDAIGKPKSTPQWKRGENIWVISCDEPGGGGGRGLIDFVAAPKGYRTHSQFIRDWGRMKADYVIAKTNGRAKVITFSQSDVLGIKYESEAIKQELARCKGCQVVANVSFTLPDFATGGVFKKFQTALLQHPEANAVVTLYDAIIILAVAPALQQAGRTKMIVAGGEGDPSNLELIRRNKLRSCAFAVAVQDAGYPIADNMIRLLAHKRPVDQATAVLLIDKQHNLKRIHGYYNGFFPYAKYYSKLGRNAK